MLLNAVEFTLTLPLLEIIPALFNPPAAMICTAESTVIEPVEVLFRAPPLFKFFAISSVELLVIVPKLLIPKLTRSGCAIFTDVPPEILASLPVAGKP